MDPFIDLKRRTLARHLRGHIQGEVRFDETSRQLYSTDASIYQIEPLGVVIPRSVQDLLAVVQIAGEMRVPITARGGGTSLSGQSIGPGIILDCSKYLNRVLDIDPVGQVARIQPGIVLDQLNRALAGHGLQFGPEVATSNRANLGGMIGNNSAGSRSIVYGKTIDHVRGLDVILSDGSQASFRSLTPPEWQQHAAGRTLEADLYRTVGRIAHEHEDEIRRRFPRILRRVSGYNLDCFANGPASFGLHQIMVGSEGTLGVTTVAEVGLVPVPKVRGLVVPHFTSMQAAMEAVGTCLEMKPSAVEVLDGMILNLARENLSLRDTMSFIQGRPAMVLMVEFSSDDPKEVADRVDRLQERLQGLPGVSAVLPVLDPAMREPLWNLRRSSMPLLYGIRGDRKPATFVEDTAVSPERLPEFIQRFRDVLQSHGTDGAFYGHASVGCMHIRPLLNLKDPGDVTRMRQITEEVTDLVLEYGGALSGEHGDGLARSEWNRKMFGPVIYEAFRKVKHAFDPHNLLNPGKVVDAPAMTENLRYAPPYHPVEPHTVLDFNKQEGFIRSVEMCNGAGACRKLQGGTMCPSFRATQDEKDSTRGRANALRLTLAGENQQTGLPFHGPGADAVHDVLDLCLMCKACKAECPSNVDMAKLKAEFLSFYYEGRRRPLGQALMGRIHLLNALAAPAAPFVNWFQNRGLVRWLMEKTAGIDRRRSLPPIHANHFRRWFARHVPAPSAGRHGRVILLDDCFTTFNEPHIGKAAVEVLEKAGYTIELANLACCGRPLISKGCLSEARDLIQHQILSLSRRVADGKPILGLEPSCLLTLVDEWPDLVPSEDAKRIANQSELADGWLAKQVHVGRCELHFPSPLGGKGLGVRGTKCVLHGHCHQKALVGTGGTVAALKLVPGLDATVLDTGCCGMAGSFGYEKQHYDLSVKIAGLSLLPALQAAPGATIVAPGTSCRHQIKDLAHKRALHPLEVIQENLEK